MKKEDAEAFLQKHGIYVSEKYAGYHYAYALYVLYLTAALKLAEDIEDGIYFDETDAVLLLDNLSEAKKVFLYYREKMDIKYAGFDIAEKITLKGCRLEEGKIVGNLEEAAQIARMWIRDYQNEKVNFFIYEVGIYILFLMEKEVDYSSLIRRRE